MLKLAANKTELTTQNSSFVEQIAILTKELETLKQENAQAQLTLSSELVGTI